MGKKAAGLVLALAITLLLSGCWKCQSWYTIVHVDDGEDYVEAEFTAAVHEDWVVPSEPYNGSRIGDIHDDVGGSEIQEAFIHGWYVYSFHNDRIPLTALTSTPEHPWQIQIEEDGDSYIIRGFGSSDDYAPIYDNVREYDGNIRLEIACPGYEITQATGAAELQQGSDATAIWWLVSSDEGNREYDRAPYMRCEGSEEPAGPEDTIVDPGPRVPPPEPSTTPSDPDPEPGVPSPSPSLTPAAKAEEAPDGNSALPWAIGTGVAALCAAAGVGAYALGKKQAAKAVTTKRT